MRSPERLHGARRGARVLGALALAVPLLAAAIPAHGAKWRHCPTDLGWYPSRIGALSAPFIHPGRELGIFLTEREQRESGGFSTEPDGNTVRITFASLWGSPIELPLLTAAAVSPGTLYVTFPDTRATFGRPLAGPVAVQVTTGGVLTADILPRNLVGLPPPTDVGKLVSAGLEQAALGTMDARGAIWIPVEFSAYGTMEKPMPMCPGVFIPLTAFAVGVTVRATPSFVLGAAPSYPPFRALRKVDLFLGDFYVGGTNFYGMKVGNLPVFRIPRGWGIKVCGANDAVDLVMRAPGFTRWAKPWSAFGAWMPASRPLEIVLNGLTVDQGNLGTRGLDGFGEECVGQ
jgi:hypothetical protein